VADGDLAQEWDAAVEEGEVFEAEVVAGVYSEAKAPGGFCGLYVGGYGFLGVFGI